MFPTRETLLRKNKSTSTWFHSTKLPLSDAYCPQVTKSYQSCMTHGYHKFPEKPPVSGHATDTHAIILYILCSPLTWKPPVSGHATLSEKKVPKGTLFVLYIEPSKVHACHAHLTHTHLLFIHRRDNKFPIICKGLFLHMDKYLSHLVLDNTVLNKVSYVTYVILLLKSV